MARRIRNRDWTGHPLGSPDTWPVALRSALGIALNSAFPTCIYWGSDLRLLYNDAWSVIPGPRHPACLGERAADVWSDIWPVIEPQLSEVITTGEGVYVRNQLLPMRRYGIEEETYWDYNFTPIRDEDGSIAGIVNSGNDTTAMVLQDRHTRFLLDMSDAFRGMRDAAAVRARCLEMLGLHLGVDRVGFRQRVGDESDAPLPVVEQWCAPGINPISEETGNSAVSDEVLDDLLGGRVIRLDSRDAANDGGENEFLNKLGCAAALAVPWLEQGETVAVLFVHSHRERLWTDLDVRTVEEVLERMMAWLDRARALERERLLSREIDHRARNLLAIVNSIVRLAKPEDPKVMQAKLLDRIAALGKTHSLLSDNRQGPLEMKKLLDEELAPYIGAGAAEITTSGPDIILDPDQTQAFAMALHELGTNAAKYGALSEKGGSLSVTWDVTDDDSLRLDWVETCRHPVGGERTEDSGYGTRLLNAVVESQLEGRIVRDLSGTGLRCMIEIPWQTDETSSLEAERMNGSQISGTG